MNVQHFDRHAGPLADLGDRLDVGDQRARGAVGTDREAAVDDRAHEPLDVPRDSAARRPAGRCRPCRCRARPCGAESRSARRWSACGPTGDCRPSRSVSSLSIARSRRRGAARRRDSSRRSADAAVSSHATPRSAGVRSRRRARIGAEADEKNRRRGRRPWRSTDAARDRRTHPVVHARVRAGAARRDDRGREVLAAGDDDDVVEHDVPDHDRPDDPERRARGAAISLIIAPPRVGFELQLRDQTWSREPELQSPSRTS